MNTRRWGMAILLAAAGLAGCKTTVPDPMARLLITQGVTADSGQHLRIGQRGHDRVTFQFVE